MIKKYAAAALAVATTHVYAGFGGMGNVESDGTGDVSVQEAVFIAIGLAVVYVFMKSTAIGQKVEVFCGTFWGMVVLSIAAVLVIGVVAALIR